MIDIHCHMAPALDDGAPDIEAALAMAKVAVADGITDVVCTPHITPGVYDNDAASITAAIDWLAEVLADQGIELNLYYGADVHIAPNLAERLASGEVPSIAASKYFLFEPTHHVLPPRLASVASAALAAGFVPVLTHPERLSWIEDHYSVVRELSQIGCLIQLTAASVTGGFGRRPRYWSERMLDEGIVDVLATDAHNVSGRPPVLSRARDAVAERLGENEALMMVVDRPAAMISGSAVPGRPPARQTTESEVASKRGQGLFGWLGMKDR